MSSNSMKDNQAKPNHRKVLRDELQFLGQMASTETALFHQKAAEQYGLGITDMKALSTLLQEGQMTAGQLAVRLSLTTGAVTNLLDRLEKRGVVKRLADPKDRRKVIVKANTNKLKDTGNIYESIGQSFDTLARTFSTQDLEFLVAYYKASIQLTKQEITKLSKNQPRA